MARRTSIHFSSARSIPLRRWEVIFRVGALGARRVAGFLVIVSLALSFLLSLLADLCRTDRVVGLIIAGVWYLITHLQYATGLDGYSFLADDPFHGAEDAVL